MPDLISDELPARSLVRLVSGAHLLGTGFVLTGDLIATCEHVIGAHETATAEFRLLGGASCAVEVVARDAEADVAVLRMVDPPDGALPAPVRLDDLRDQRFRTLGFTAAEPDGVWVEGRLVGRSGSGRIQVRTDAHGERIEPGFSGAPVWDEQLRGVVGMVVTRSGNNATTAHLVPISRLGEWAAPGRNPYLGLRTFQAADAELFHGREEEIAELLELLDRQDLVAIAGPSGSGKSSLVRAGVLPALGAPVVELRADDPLDAVPDGAVLFLDQFEEEVTADPAAARARLAAVIRLVTSRDRRPGQPAPLRAVLTLRSRSLDDLITADTRQELNKAVWLLEPMGREQMRAAIVQPAARAGAIGFEAGLVDRILDDARGQSTLPLLSKALEQLWDSSSGGWLTHTAYDEIGRLPGALSKHADAALAALRPKDEALARRLLTQLARPDGEGGFSRRSARIADLDPELREVAHELAAHRLLVIRDEHVGLVHQALIDHWPALRDRLTEDADFLAWLSRLQQLQESGGQLRDTGLAEAVGWLAEREQDVPAAQQDFIRRSAAAHRRNQNRWRTISAITGVLALVAAVLTGVVLNRNSALEDRIRTSNATDLAGVANRATAGNPAEALQIALAAWREKPGNPDAYGALLAQRLYWRGADRVLPPQQMHQVMQLVSSEDGRVVAAIPQNRADQVTAWWGLAGPNPTSRAIGEDGTSTVTMSPDGRWLAGQGDGPGVRLWDLAAASSPVVLAAEEINAAARFSANGRFLAVLSGTDDGPQRVRVWDLDGMRELPSRVVYPSDGPTSSVREVYPTSDGRALVATERVRTSAQGDDVYAPVVRDLATGAQLRTLPAADDGSAVLLGAGTHAATCEHEAITVFDTATGGVRARYPVPQCRLELDESGQYFLVDLGSYDGTPPEVIRWRTGERLVLGDSADSASWGSAAPLLVPAPDGSLTAVSVRHGAVQTSSLPIRRGPVERAVTGLSLMDRSADGRRWIAYVPDGTGFGGSIALLDEQGAAVGRTAAPRSPNGISFDATGERFAVVVGTTLQIYRTAGMVLEREVQLPVPSGHEDELRDFQKYAVLAVGPSGDLLVSQLGILSTWDLRTGVQAAPPLVLEPVGEWDSLRAGPDFVLRPGHLEQAVVQTNTEIAVWDLRTRTRLKSFPMNGYYMRPTLSADGSVAAVVTEVGTSVVLIDLANLTEFAPLTGEIDRVIGISGDYLFAQKTLDFQVWDWRQHRLVTSITLDGTGETSSVEGDALVPNTAPGRRDAIPLDPDAWFDDLCRISARDFTEDELRQLPEGVSQDPPCLR
ncbi:hypothetical protein F1721_15365 [Saccharopolyspora hirsuta]|uniref:Novel STAND NTPase 1 domain-containing protein n=1 Tax=Saccharopolyspora hirsuta TaxID=1837 RepID=A0A5M7C5Q4_SACHI|nr:trypsin-like peptidase domain-containing protein [Saccharopolyspora hirsuta]KAA5833645.1 hypothetical protein F1721_15365 [Saccharopolyspora hirsuta]